MSGVNPAILRWARETAGLSLEQAAEQIKLNPARGRTGAERLAAIEAGEIEPTRSLLLRMADRYRRSLIAFYLPEPPPTGDRGQDFRRAADAPPIDFDPRLDALLRNMRSRQDVVRALLEDEDADPREFVGRLRESRSAATIAEDITGTIGFDLAEFRRARDVRAAFSYLRQRLEGAGIFVLLIGNLGSYHSNIPATIFRGYAIADRIAPFIVINENDASASWSFTALHEAAHLWLGQTGVSGANHALRIEQLCNDVAGRILLPRVDVDRLAHLAGRDFDDLLSSISEHGARFNVSRRMVAYQLMRADIIDFGLYRRLCDRFSEDWLRSRARDPDQFQEESAVSFYVVRRHRLGPAFIDLVRRSVASGALTPTRASRLLGLKEAVSVHPLLHASPA